jgi:hypothetical protein
MIGEKPKLPAVRSIVWLGGRGASKEHRIEDECEHDENGYQDAEKNHATTTALQHLPHRGRFAGLATAMRTHGRGILNLFCAEWACFHTLSVDSERPLDEKTIHLVFRAVQPDEVICATGGWLFSGCEGVTLTLLRIRSRYVYAERNKVRSGYEHPESATRDEFTNVCVVVHRADGEAL